MNNLFFSNNCNCQDHRNLPINNNLTSDNKYSNIKKIKNNTINSLNEVEYFLNNIQRFSYSIKLYKILKRL